MNTDHKIARGACRSTRADGTALTGFTLVAALLAAALLLAGCASQGDVRPAGKFSSPQTLGATATTTPWPATRWWSAYGDAQLDRLIDTALADQPSLQTTESRLRQAEAAVASTDALRGIHANATADLTGQRFSENGLIPPPLGGTTQWTADAQVGLGWELDLFGRQRASLDAAIGQLRAAQADSQAANVLLAANVAAGYFNLARLVEPEINQ